MSNDNYWDDEDEDTTISPNNSDEKNFNNLRKAKRADEKRIKELTEKLESLERAQSERTVKEILEQKGVNPKAARLILKDLESVDEQSITGWLDENGDLFGFSSTEGTPKVDSETIAAIKQQDSLTQGALTPERAQDLEYKIENAQSKEELQRIVFSQN